MEMYWLAATVDEDELNALSMYLTRSIFLNRIVVVDLNHTQIHTLSHTHFIYYYLCIDQTLHRSDQTCDFI